MVWGEDPHLNYIEKAHESSKKSLLISKNKSFLLNEKFACEFTVELSYSESLELCLLISEDSLYVKSFSSSIFDLFLLNEEFDYVFVVQLLPEIVLLNTSRKLD